MKQARKVYRPSGLEFFILLQHLGKEGFQAGVLGVREQFLRRLVLLNLAIVDEAKKKVDERQLLLDFGE